MKDKPDSRRLPRKPPVLVANYPFALRQNQLHYAILRGDAEKVRDLLEGGAYPQDLLMASERTGPNACAIIDMLWMAGATFTNQELSRLGGYLNPATRHANRAIIKAEGEEYRNNPTAKHLSQLMAGKISLTPEMLEDKYDIAFNLNLYQQNVAENPLYRPPHGKLLSSTLTYLDTLTPTATAGKRFVDENNAHEPADADRFVGEDLGENFGMDEDELSNRAEDLSARGRRLVQKYGLEESESHGMVIDRPRHDDDLSR